MARRDDETESRTDLLEGLEPLGGDGGTRESLFSLWCLSAAATVLFSLEPILLFDVS